ncbi:MAG: methyltransferase domain-containing protein [Opitutaceae bacterium]|nr:methyltransferase domain-containing protein [Opitutaceae bacterium]
MNPQDWSDRYRSHNTKWDLGHSPLGLEAYIAKLSERKKIQIPGCGRGYEIMDFHKAGHDVIAIDFSEGAIEEARHVIGPLADAIICDDFFEAPLEEGHFDLCYERTFFCAIPLEKRRDYGSRIASLLNKSGLLMGVFLYGKPDPDGPPFPMTKEDRERFIEPFFSLLFDERDHNGLPVFNENEERWQIWQKR